MQLQRCSHTEASAALVLECTSTQQDMMEVLQLHVDGHSFSKRAIMPLREAGRRSYYATGHHKETNKRAWVVTFLCHP